MAACDKIQKKVNPKDQPTLPLGRLLTSGAVIKKLSSNRNTAKQKNVSS